MPSTITIPGIGPMKSTYVYVGGAAVAGIVGYAYWRSKQSAAADTTATDTTSTDQALADANAAASDPSLAYGGYGYDTSGYAYGGAPIYQSPGNNNFPTPTGGHPSSDPEWNQAAYEALTNRGVDGQAASHALSLYMANLCMSAVESDLVRQAIGAIGDTPQTHHTINICPSAPPPSGGGTAPPPTGLRNTGTTKSSVALSWSPVQGATLYLIHIDGGGISHSISTTGSHYTFNSLHKGTTYHFNVRSVVGGVTSKSSPTVTVKTKTK